MENLFLSPLQKPLSKHHMRSKKKQQPPPRKVVYITNPMKFKASASEFKALVQELTGKQADYPLPPQKFGRSSQEADAAAGKAVGEESRSRVGEFTDCVAKMERPVNAEAWQEGSDPSISGSGYEALYSPEDFQFQGIFGSNLLHDVIQSLDCV